MRKLAAVVITAALTALTVVTAAPADAIAA